MYKRILFVCCISVLMSCSMPVGSPPAAPATAIPQPSPVARATRAVATPTTPRATSVSDVVTQMNEAQRRCVAIQIGKERVPQIQNGAELNPTEEAVITACAADANSVPTTQAAQPTPQAAPAQDNPVFRDEAWITSSADGIRWDTPAQLDTAASVPEIVALPDGSLLAMWCSFKDKPARFAEKLATARLAKGATTWELLGTTIIPGAAEAGITFVDPDLLVLPDGRIRLYAYNIQTDDGTHAIVSAISQDNGKTFTLEDGVRFTTTKMWDPNVVIMPDGTYRMYYNGKDAIRSASSEDGLTFSADAGERWVNGAIPGALVEGDTIWLYGCEKGLSRKQSTDGLTFSQSERLSIKAPDGKFFCDPSITKTADRYWLILKLGTPSSAPKP